MFAIFLVEICILKPSSKIYPSQIMLELDIHLSNIYTFMYNYEDNLKVNFYNYNFMQFKHQMLFDLSLIYMDFNQVLFQHILKLPSLLQSLNIFTLFNFKFLFNILLKPLTENQT